MDWKLVILGRLRLRNAKESGGFTELIASHMKLQDLVESQKREITRLEYQKNELERERDEDQGVGASINLSGDASREIQKYRKKVEDLQTKHTSNLEELMVKQNQLIEAVSAVKKKDDELRSKDSIIQRVESSNKALEGQVASLKQKVQEAESVNVMLKDEQLANQVSSTKLEEKFKALTKDYDVMRTQLIQIRSEQADKLNEANEFVRRQRDKRLEDDIKRAAEEKDPLLDSRSLGSADGGIAGTKKRSSDSTSSRRGSRHQQSSDRKPRANSGGGDSVASEVVGPSIHPSSVTHCFDAHDSEVSALGFSPDGSYLATGGGDKLVKVWSWRPSQGKMELKFTLRGFSQSVMSVQFDQNSRQVLAGSNDGSARIWTLHDERPKHTLTGHSNRVMAAKFLEDNMKVVTGSHDRTLKIWDLLHKACTRTLFAGSSCNDVVAGRGMGTTVISGHFDKRIRFWDTRTATANEIALQGKVTSLDHYPDKHWLLCCSRDDTLRLIDLRQNSIMTTFNGSGFRVGVDWTRACFSPDGQYVAAGSSDGSIFVWDTYNSSSKPKKEKCKEHNKDVVVCSWDPTGQMFVSGDRSKKAVLWSR